LSITALFYVKMSCSSIATSSLIYVTGFSVKYFVQAIYTDNANQAYFDKRSRLNLCSETAETN